MNDITTAMIDFPANGSNAPGYLARPVGDGSYPAVVVIQEWWGLDGHIKQVAERMAQAGYVALAPDLFRGEVAIEPDDARRLVMQLERPKIALDVQGAINYLLAQPFVQPKKAGVMGFCFGGGVAGTFSYSGHDVGAVVSFYGGGFKITDEIATSIKVPILAIYGEQDQGIPMETVRENVRQLKLHDIPHDVVVYPDAPHAFFNDTRPAYRPEAATDAFSRTLAWFEEYLKA